MLKRTQPPESPYTRRKKVIFLKRKVANLSEIWRIRRNCAKKNICAKSTYASTHALNLRKKKII